jgi:hypothetical protein
LTTLHTISYAIMFIYFSYPPFCYPSTNVLNRVAKIGTNVRNRVLPIIILHDLYRSFITTKHEMFTSQTLFTCARTSCFWYLFVLIRNSHERRPILISQKQVSLFISVRILLSLMATYKYGIHLPMYSE